MLSEEPVRVQARVEREVPLISQFPDDIAGAISILIIDLQHPVLVPQRNQQIPVILGIDQRIGVGPVWKEQGMSIHVQVVEGIPHPNRIVVRIQINDRISADHSLSGISRQVGESSRIADYQQQVTIGKQHEVVIDGKNLQIVAGVLELLAQSVIVKLVYHIACQVNFTHNASGTTLQI